MSAPPSIDRAMTEHPSRRGFLGIGSGAVAALALPAEARTRAAARAGASYPTLTAVERNGMVDFGDGLANTVAFMKMMTTFGDTPVFGGLTGVFNALVGESLTPVFGYAGYRLHQSRIIAAADGTRQVEVRGKEAGCYTDLATGEIIRDWKNPWTGETVATPPWFEPGRVEVFPAARSAGSFIANAHGTWTMGGLLRPPAPPGTAEVPFSVAWRRIGDRYFNASNASTRFINPVTREGWPKASTGEFVTQHELLEISTDARAIGDASAPHASFDGVLTRNMPWLPFTRMGQSGVAGRMTGVIQIYKTTGAISDVPAPLRRLLERERPAQLEPMTSWAHTIVRPGGTWQHYARETPPETPGYVRP